MKLRWLRIALVLGLFTAVVGSARAAWQPFPFANGPIAQPQQSDTARVKVAHLAPFAAESANTAVDIRISGTNVLTNVVFGQISPYLPLATGTYTLEVLPTGTSTIAISAIATVEANRDYTVAAVGDNVNQPLELLVLADNNAGPLGAFGNVRVVHAAPFANPLDATRVNLVDASDDVVAGLENLPFKAVSDYLPFDSDEYTGLRVVTADGAITLIELPDLTINNGMVVTIFAVGNGSANFPAAVLLDVAVEGVANDTVSAKIAHLAPFAPTAAATGVDIELNGDVVGTGVRFGAVSDYLPLSTGNNQVRVLLAGTSTVALSETFTVLPGSNLTIAAIGDGDNQPLELISFLDESEPAAGANGKLRIIHAAPFADTLDGTRVDIRDANDDVVAGLANIPFKAASPFLVLPAATYSGLKVTTPGGATTLIEISDLVLLPSSIVTAFAIGNGSANFPPSILVDVNLQGDNGEREALVKFAHLAPFAADLAGTAVDIRVNNTEVISNVRFGQISDEQIISFNISAPSLLVEVLPTGTSTVAISATTAVSDGDSLFFLALGDGDNQPLEGLFIPRRATTAPADGFGKVRIVHAAPFSNTLDGTRVDVRDPLGAVIGGLENIPYKQVSDYLELPAVVLSGVTVTTPGGETTLINVPDLAINNGDLITIFAVGNGSANFPPSIVVDRDATIPPGDAFIRPAHLAPFAETLAGTAVDIRVNGNTLPFSLTFGTVLFTHLAVPPGNYTFEVLPAGTNTVAISASVVLSSNVYYTLAAVGDGTNQPLELLSFIDDISSPTGLNGKLRIIHAAPFADTLDGTRVDIRDANGDLVAGLANIPFKAASPYLTLPAGTYSGLRVTTPGGATTLIAIPTITLNPGQVTTAYAVGNGSANFPPSIITSTEQRGNEPVHLPLIAFAAE